MVDTPDDAQLDGECGFDPVETPLPDNEVDLFTLFAEALDPATPVTVEDRAAEWQELFNG